MFKTRFFFYFISFLEGASVMTAELLGAKMMAPYFGSSLYVWASVLGITLSGLALGYFTGGWVSKNKNHEKNLYIILLASAVFLILMPLTSKEVMLHTSSFPFLISILLSSVVFLFPPVFFMGMVSPLMVQCCANGNSDSENHSGEAAGTVFAISTLGGIISTFLSGFYLIPEFGLTRPAVGMGCLLGLIPFVKLITAKKFFSLIFPFAMILSFNSAFQLPYGSSDVRILYSDEGLLGQIIVADYPLYEGNRPVVGFQRILFVNRSTQTVVIYKQGKKEPFEYVNRIADKCIHAINKSPALVLGLGGGSVANVLVVKGYHVDAVELDERMADCAKNYFSLDEKVNVNIDDARHYVRFQTSSLKPQISVIVLDAFVGEVNPHHLFTKEFFSQVKALLSDTGTFFINGNGFWSGNAGKGMRSVCKTLLASGFDVELLPTHEPEEYRNLLFVCKKSKNENGALISKDVKPLDLSEDIILTDEKPLLEILNAEANRRWREGCMKYFLSGYYSGQDRLFFK